MIFHLKLFRIAVSARKQYLLWAFVPVLAYLIVAAFLPHNFVVIQNLEISDNMLLAPGPNPLDLVNITSVLNDPQPFLTDNQVLMDLREHLLTGGVLNRPDWSGWLPSRFALFIKRTVLQEVTLQSVAEGRVQVQYDGTDRDLGKALVKFYAQRLVWAGQRAQERAILRPDLLPQAAGAVPVTLSGDLTISTSRTILTSDRLVIALWLLAVFALVALAAIWLMELARPKLYSERQTSRYLDTPVLGIIPNLEHLNRF